MIRCSRRSSSGTGTTPTGRTAPLRQAEDAVVVDTTELNFEESLAALLTVVRGKAAL